MKTPNGYEAIRHTASNRQPWVVTNLAGRWRGGLAVSKHTRVGNGAIIDIPLPAELIHPLVNYRREALKPYVRVGQHVRGGQILAEGVLAGSSGTVSAIAERPLAHPSNRLAPAVVIATDGRDANETLPRQLSLDATRIAVAGIRGLGGAGFPLNEKVASVRRATLPLLLINAVECEPGNDCDSALIRADSQAVIDGILALVELMRAERCLIAVEENNPAVIAGLEAAVTRTADRRLAVAIVPARYPAGAERLLLRLLNARAPLAGERPTDVGALCVNVATAWAAGRARAGEPMLSRVVTLTGEHMPQPANVRVRLGTPIAHLLASTGNADLSPANRLYVGGPLSGFELRERHASVLATTHSLHAVGEHKNERVTACIRCGACAEVCPEALLPQELYRYARHGSEKVLRRLRIDDCIACGCCDQVCPARLPLTASFRHAASRVAEAEQTRVVARYQARRFAAHNARATARQAERDADIARRKAAVEARDSSIDAALARVRARRRTRT